MKWRDLLYFSKGERQALTLLLILIVMAWILLIISDGRSVPDEVVPTYIVHPENVPQPVPVDTTSEKTVESARIPAPVPSPKKQSTSRRSPVKTYSKPEKYSQGTIVELNTADTTVLKKVPGIGSVFASRIVKYRDLLGGFYSVSQLQEVYGMDEERYQALQGWFHADTSFIAKIPINKASCEWLPKHPYLNYKQARAICRLRKQKGRLSGWENLLLLEEFNKIERIRLEAYISFD
ncbi:MULTISPECIES: helix-hairpin-helix domain-containing protein [unclassified Parabacteroides]|nr:MULTISPECIES: helix-hairpin-helix domain-containing protein [unclassified Parabacteroides]MDH6344909.1 competence protein ComEA [Parabacteroides sp. PH5-46]MDH6375488.1 competence protein ComEA [Parabacteroides sp. PH5-33]